MAKEEMLLNKQPTSTINVKQYNKIEKDCRKLLCQLLTKGIDVDEAKWHSHTYTITFSNIVIKINFYFKIFMKC